MNKKVMLEFPNGERHWGYATTEHAYSNYNMPVIVCGKNVYGCKSIGDIQIIVNDIEVVKKLKQAGFNPISRNDAKKRRNISFTDEMEEIILKQAEEEGITFNDMVSKILNKHLGH